MKKAFHINKIIFISVFSVTLLLLFNIFSHAADTRYSYDPLNRLIKTDYSNGITVQYAYDEVGNRQTKATTQSPDTDADDYYDNWDNCLNTSNPDQKDTDTDSVGDACDNCPNIANQNQADTDNDNIGDVCDTCPNDAQNDADGDGICGDLDNCASKPNGPNSGTCSSTSDKPGVNCTSDADCANGCSSNGLCIKDQRDADGDNIGDVCDCAPLDNAKFKSWTVYVDADNDGHGAGTAVTICDGATLPAGYSELSDDGCPDDPTKTVPGICGCGVPDMDSDGDGVPDCNDNCPNNCNVQQLDADGDGIGDVCDPTPGCGGCSGIQCETQC